MRSRRTPCGFTRPTSSTRSRRRSPIPTPTCPALLAAPLRFLTGDPLLTNSLLVLATFVVAATGVYSLIASICGDRGAAFIAGLAYAFLPYRMVHLWHLNWLEGAYCPGWCWRYLRLIDRPSLGRGFTLGLLAAVLVLTSFYFSIQVAIIGVVIVVAWSIAAKRRPPDAFFRSAAAAGALALAIAVPLYAPYLQVREEQRLERSIIDAEQYKALPASYLRLAPWDVPNPVQRLLGVRVGANESLTEVGQQHADGHQHREIVIEDALYPGALAMVSRAPQLAPAALARDRPGDDRTDCPRSLAGTELRTSARPGPAIAVWLAVRSRPVFQSHARTGETRWAHEPDNRAPGRTGVGCNLGPPARERQTAAVFASRMGRSSAHSSARAGGARRPLDGLHSYRDHRTWSQRKRAGKVVGDPACRPGDGVPS